MDQNDPINGPGLLGRKVCGELERAGVMVKRVGWAKQDLRPRAAIHWLRAVARADVVVDQDTS